jgi:C-terminal processing protease CtpA/Prc
MTRKLAAAVLLVGSLACHGIDSPSSSTPTADCSTLGQVQSVRTTLRDIYLWYKDLPDPSPTGFSSPEAYLEAVRYKALDTTYSYIANKAESDAFFSESQFIGIGISSRQTGPAELRISQVFPGGPAAEAGLARGDYLLAINGRAVGDLIRTGQIDTIFGANQIGVPVALAWRSLPGAELQATITKRLVTIPIVSQTAVFDLPAARAGYVHLRNFVTPSTEALNVAFRALVDVGANELILDLRYNGGGLVSVAQHLTLPSASRWASTATTSATRRSSPSPSRAATRGVKAAISTASPPTARRRTTWTIPSVTPVRPRWPKRFVSFAPADVAPPPPAWRGPRPSGKRRSAAGGPGTAGASS